MITHEQSLKDFIAKNGKPYNPKDDQYEREPFAADIKEGKNNPIYNAHSYHTKVPPRSIIPYVLHYTDPGDIVLDPFCGSGMTGVACIMCENPPRDLIDLVPGIKRGARRAILNDLSPAACHIAYNYCTQMDVKSLKDEFEKIKSIVKEEFDWLYRTEHYEPAKEQYDPLNPEIYSRLKNPPKVTEKDRPSMLFDKKEERSWELLSHAEVEKRIGAEALKKYPLPKGVKQFICIPAIVQYTIWSDMYKCEGMLSIPEPGKKSKKRVARGCGKEIVLWDVAVDHENAKVKEVFECPHCGQMWSKLALSLLKTIPVWTSYTYKDYCGKSRRGIKIISQSDIEKLNKITLRGIHISFPNISIDTGRELMTMGPANRGMSRLSDFYTPRNQWALGLLWQHLSKVQGPVVNSLKFAFTAILDVASRRNRFPQQAVMSSTLYVPSIQIEMNVLSQFERRVGKLVKGAFSGAVSKINTSKFIKIRLGDARSFLEVPDSSIDYVFADPPFGGNIYYADASILVDAWLGSLTDEKNELVFNRQRRKDEYFKVVTDYAHGMAMAFRELFRILKPGRWATVEFNNSDGQVFEVIKKAVRDAGFEIENMLFLDKVQKSFKQIKGVKGEEDVVGHDVLFNLRKPRPTDEKRKENGEDRDLANLIVEAVQNHLQTLPERIQTDPKTYSNEHRTTPFLNTMLMSTLIPRGVNVDSLNLPFIERLCARYFKKIEKKWYLKNELIGNQHGENGTFIKEVEVKDEVSAIEWLRERLSKNSMMIGDLKPLWFRAMAKLAGDLSIHLERILHQNFWLDRATNKWKEPTDEERSRMDSTESERVIHEAERYLAGHLNRSPSDKERCQWIGLLYEKATALEEELSALESAVESPSSVIKPEEILNLYQLMTKLYQGILKEKVEDDLYQKASRQVRIASAKQSQKREDDDKADQVNNKSSYQYKLF